MVFLRCTFLCWRLPPGHSLITFSSLSVGYTHFSPPISINSDTLLHAIFHCNSASSALQVLRFSGDYYYRESWEQHKLQTNCTPWNDIYFACARIFHKSRESQVYTTPRNFYTFINALKLTKQTITSHYSLYYVKSGLPIFNVCSFFFCKPNHVNIIILKRLRHQSKALQIIREFYFFRQQAQICLNVMLVPLIKL